MILAHRTASGGRNNGRRPSGSVVGNPYLGISSRLLVIRSEWVHAVFEAGHRGDPVAAECEYVKVDPVAYTLAAAQRRDSIRVPPKLKAWRLRISGVEKRRRYGSVSSLGPISLQFRDLRVLGPFDHLYFLNRDCAQPAALEHFPTCPDIFSRVRQDLVACACIRNRLFWASWHS